jgi:hypothetical protein
MMQIQGVKGGAKLSLESRYLLRTLDHAPVAHRRRSSRASAFPWVKKSEKKHCLQDFTKGDFQNDCT